MSNFKGLVLTFSIFAVVSAVALADGISTIPPSGAGATVGGGVIASASNTSYSTYTVIGGTSFDATGKGDVTFYATGYVTDENCTLSVLLRNETGAADVTTLTTSAVSATLMQSGVLSLTAAARVYSVQIKITGASCGLGQTAFVYSAGLSF